MKFETFRQSLQKLIGYYTRPEFNEELQMAKKEFFDNTGSLDENKPNYNLRMHQFYEWYFITRPLKSYMKPPVTVCDQHRDLRLTDEDQQTINIILQSHIHALFEFVKVKKEILVVKNLMTGDKMDVHQSSMVFGFDNKEYFQARVVEVDGKKYFLNSFCFHPESSQKFIQSEIKALQKNRDLSLEDLLLRLNKMRYKFEQYKHVKPELIYTNDNKLGL